MASSKRLDKLCCLPDIEGPEGLTQCTLVIIYQWCVVNSLTTHLTRTPRQISPSWTLRRLRTPHSISRYLHPRTCRETTVHYCVCLLWTVFKFQPHSADHWLTFPLPNPPTSPLQGYIIALLSILFLSRVISSTLKMEVTRSSETSVYNKPTWRHIPEDGILQCQRC
jgi:hypothetical protein